MAEYKEHGDVEEINNDSSEKRKESVLNTSEVDSAEGMAEIRRVLTALTGDSDKRISRKGRITLSSILGGDMLGGLWFRRHFGYIVMLVFMLIFYVSNRYACERAMLTTKALTDTLVDRRYKALTRSSLLKEKTLRSNIEESLVDTTLQTAVTPSFILKVE